jgi:hypothetical protein
LVAGIPLAIMMGDGRWRHVGDPQVEFVPDAVTVAFGLSLPELTPLPSAIPPILPAQVNAAQAESQ